jgi:hypothetical protein
VGVGAGVGGRSIVLQLDSTVEGHAVAAERPGCCSEVFPRRIDRQSGSRNLGRRRHRDRDIRPNSFRPGSGRSKPRLNGHCGVGVGDLRRGLEPPAAATALAHGLRLGCGHSESDAMRHAVHAARLQKRKRNLRLGGIVILLPKSRRLPGPIESQCMGASPSP